MFTETGPRVSPFAGADASFCDQQVVLLQRFARDAVASETPSSDH